jgi:hypothetical protein
MAVCLLLLDDKNHIPLFQADAMAAISAFCDAANPVDFSHGMPLNVDSLPPFHPLLTSPFLPARHFYAILLAVVVHRSLHMGLASPALFFGNTNPFRSELEEIEWGERDARSIEMSHRCSLLLKHSVTPRLRILSVDESPAIRGIAWSALSNVNEKAFVAAKSLTDFCERVEGPGRAAVALEKILSAEDFQIHELLHSLDDADWNPIFSSLKLKRGTLVRLIGIGKHLSGVLKADRDFIASEMTSLNDLRMESLTSEIPSSSNLSRSPSQTLTSSISSSFTPEVFLSYSWANQDSVKRIKKCLEKEGISCWMDVEAMHGGQSLFAEIDRGVSQCSVFVSCLSPSYETSTNCQREIQLAIDRQKVIIPIWVLSLSQWPPSGSMGPLLAGKLYIDMSNEEKYDENFPHLIHSIRSSLKSF